MNSRVPSPQPPAPSRHNNPFATCWTKPGAVSFQFPEGQSAESLIARLAAASWCGEIIGPHGSGKSTLLATLVPRLSAAGRQVSMIALRAGQRSLPREFLRRALTSPRALVVVDGYEQLSAGARLGLRWRCRRAAAGLLVTSHKPTGLPALASSAPDLELVAQLVARLTHHVPSPITAADVAASHACRGSNVREIMFDLYDRHERASRATRTAAPSSA